MISQIPIYIAAVMLLAFGVRYLGTQRFMPYHEVITGKSWEQVEPGMQVAILGMLRICGASFFSYGVLLVWLLYPLSRGETWAAWAILTSALTMLLPILLVTVWLRRREPRAKTPVIPSSVALVLVVGGAVASFF